MAYSFDGTANRRLTASSAPVTAAPFTLFARIRATGTGSNRRILQIADSSSVDRFALQIVGNNFPLLARYSVQEGANTTDFPQGTAGNVTANTWYAQTAVETATNSRALFLDTATFTNTTSRTPSSISLTSIGGTSNAAGFTAFNGQIAEAAMWNATLTADEIKSLAQGFKPTRIRPQSLKFYAPLVRDLHDLRDALTITNNNTVTVADHPRVY